MTSNGTAFADSVADAREPTVTCSVNPSVNAKFAVSVAPSTMTSIACVGRPSASTFTWTRRPCSAARGMVSVYRPSRSVVAVKSEPDTETTAPATGAPSVRVVTTPEMEITSRAETGEPDHSKASNAQSARRVVIRPSPMNVPADLFTAEIRGRGPRHTGYYGRLARLDFLVAIAPRSCDQWRDGGRERCGNISACCVVHALARPIRVAQPGTLRYRP